ncbi:MAG TPA: protein translocase subunit SecF [Aquificales bacterium]|nr:protein translocase subunit SecF [Aquificales bacterium]
MVKLPKNIPFMDFRFKTYILSLFLVLGSLLLIQFRGLNLGLDFTGGYVIEIAPPKPVSEEKIKELLKGYGFKSFLVQETKEGHIIVKVRLDQPVKKIEQILLEKLKGAKLVRFEMIGAVFSSELKTKAIYAILSALMLITLYLGFRFKPIWALTALLALFHDIIVTLGAYSLTFREVNLEVMGALLTVAGYSVTDTVVVFDRIRENLKMRPATPLKEVINISINETLSRTLMTSLTTFAVAFVLFLFGGDMLSNIAFAFLIGIAVGTYSSVFVASSLLLDISNFLSKRIKGGIKAA